jgi:hypothetical protein
VAQWVLLEAEGVEEVVLEVAQINCIAVCNPASSWPPDNFQDNLLYRIYEMPFKLDPSKNNASQALFTWNFYKFLMKTIAKT